MFMIKSKSEDCLSFSNRFVSTLRWAVVGGFGSTVKKSWNGATGIPSRSCREEENLATHQSAIKRIRQNQRRRMRNRSIQSAFKTRVKKVLRAVEAKEVDQAGKALKEASSSIARASSKGVIPRNTASRKISRLARRVNTLQK